jgi:mRNA interferase RelE/StbE
MEVDFRESFSEDLDEISTGSVLKAITRAIENCEAAETFQNIVNMKKMQGHKSAYRIKIGTYRIGIFFEDGKLEFTRVLPRSKIYKYFPK